MYSSIEIPSSSAFFFLYRRSTNTPKPALRFSVHIFLCIFLGKANFQRVPGQDELLGNRLGLNSQDHMDDCQNQLSVTCSGSWVSLGKAKPEGGRKLFTVRIRKVYVS